MMHSSAGRSLKDLKVGTRSEGSSTMNCSEGLVGGSVSDVCGRSSWELTIDGAEVEDVTTLRLELDVFNFLNALDDSSNEVDLRFLDSFFVLVERVVETLEDC